MTVPEVSQSTQLTSESNTLAALYLHKVRTIASPSTFSEFLAFVRKNQSFSACSGLNDTEIKHVLIVVNNLVAVLAAHPGLVCEFTQFLPETFELKSQLSNSGYLYTLKQTPPPSHQPRVFVINPEEVVSKKDKSPTFVEAMSFLQKVKDHTQILGRTQQFEDFKDMMRLYRAKQLHPEQVARMMVAMFPGDECVDLILSFNRFLPRKYANTLQTMKAFQFINAQLGSDNSNNSNNATAVVPTEYEDDLLNQLLNEG